MLSSATVAVLLAACGGSARQADGPATTTDTTGGAGPGVTSGAPAEPDSFAEPPAAPVPSSQNPARRSSSQSTEDLLALRSNLVSTARSGVREDEGWAKARSSGGAGGGTAGSGGMAPVARGGSTSSGGSISSGGLVDRGGGTGYGGKAIGL